MRLPNSAHAAQPWRIHELTTGFQLEDVWALPTPGGPDDFDQLLDLMRTFDWGLSLSRTVRLLMGMRLLLGKVFGWDKDTKQEARTMSVPSGATSRKVPSMRDGMAADLLAAPKGEDMGPFTSVFRLPNEWAAELYNATVHGVVHLGWVADGVGGYRGQLAVYTKRNGLLGTIYMNAIAPFRHLLVYPNAMRAFDRAWQSRTAA